MADGTSDSSAADAAVAQDNGTATATLHLPLGSPAALAESAVTLPAVTSFTLKAPLSVAAAVQELWPASPPAEAVSALAAALAAALPRLPLPGVTATAQQQLTGGDAETATTATPRPTVDLNPSLDANTYPNADDTAGMSSDTASGAAAVLLAALSAELGRRQLPLAAALPDDDGTRAGAVRTAALRLGATCPGAGDSARGLLASPTATSAINPQATLHLQFAGQGQPVLDELARVATRHPRVTRVLQVCCARLQTLAATPGLELHAEGLDVAAWLEGRLLPPEEYLLASHVSFPLITLVQLCSYLAFLAETNTAHKTFAAQVRTAFGHSQGILAATAVALAEDDSELELRIVDAVSMSFWIGARAQQVMEIAKKANAHLRLPPRSQKKKAEGTPEPEVDNPTFMLAFSGLAPEVVAACADDMNKSLRVPDAIAARVTLVNGPRSCVVTAPPVLTAELRARMGQRRAAPKESEPRVPHSKRKLVYKSAFLPVSAAFHHSALDPVVEMATADCERMGINWVVKDLKLAVLSTETAVDLRSELKGDSSLVEHLVSLIAIRPVDWPRTVAALGASPEMPAAVLDFGPGTGIARLTARNADGTQLVVACCTDESLLPESRLPSSMLDKRALLRHLALGTLDTRVADAVDWRVYRPRLVQRKHDDALLLSTRFTELIGRPPIVVAGMTPTTSLNGVSLVAAATNAGYYAELAGGGLSRPKIFLSTLDNLMQRLNPGQGIWLNLLYLNAKQWAFQFPLALSLRKQGYPIESITVAAGIPTPDKAAEIVARCKEAGLLFLSFKPGSKAAIASVVEIARAHPDYPFVVQWTGGRAGGHHSFEDMHEPILETYAQLRATPNLILVAGSGLGDGEQAFAYLDGTWSQRMGFNAMPFDGVLVASRMMVAREAMTAPEIKQMIVDTPGVASERDWEKSYDGAAGGVITVTSELGEPIHKLATRGVLLWRRFDKQYFSLARGKARDDAIARDKAKIIHGLNSDFQKPYFGRNAAGEVVDLDAMTYSEVLTRLVELLYVNAEKQAVLTAAAAACGQELPYPSPPSGSGRWLHPTFCSRVQSFALRAEERFRGAGPGDPVPAPAPPVVSPEAIAAKPAQALLEAYSEMRSTILCEEDYDFFLDLCQSGGKPVNFIPVIDGSLGVWFKKDSLWYSEDLGGVPDADPHRVVVLQGPVAVHYTRQANEPAGAILDGMVAHFRKRVSAAAQAASAAPVAVTWLGGDAAVARADALGSAMIAHVAQGLEASIPAGSGSGSGSGSGLPAHAAWLAALTPGPQTWLAALLRSPAIACGHSWVDNPVLRLLAPRAGQRVLVDNATAPTALRLYDAELSSDVPVVVLKLADRQAAGALEGAAAVVNVCVVDLLPEAKDLQLSAYELDLGFFPECGTCPFRMAETERADKASAFYSKLWLEDTPPTAPDAAVASVEDVHEAIFTPTAEGVAAFCRATQHVDVPHVPHVPLDYAIVVAWQPLVRSLFADALRADLFRLVHLSNAFTVVPAAGAAPVATGTRPSFALHVDQPVRVSMHVTEVAIGTTGKTVTVEGHLEHGSTEAPLAAIDEDSKVLHGADLRPQGRLHVTSRFFIRGAFHDYAQCFRTETLACRLTVASDAQAAILTALPWLQWTQETVPSVGSTLYIEVSLREAQTSSASPLLRVTASGHVSQAVTTPAGTVMVECASVTYEAAAPVAVNPVRAFLSEHAQPHESAHALPEGGYALLEQPKMELAPASNVPYALASSDLNPIHRHVYFARLAELPTTIVHGMWSSAAARHLVVAAAAQGVDERVCHYAVSFDGMVRPSQELFLSLRHVGMINGRLQVAIEGMTAKGERVLSGRAEVLQPPSAYVFTGQGSAETGMGMDLYQRSAVARNVWDRADKHLLRTYGISILDIVRHNPRERTIHFGGRAGAAIRRNYLALQPADDASGRPAARLLPIDAATPHLTFKSATGLLFSTQFTQVALVLQEKAAFNDMRAAGLLPQDFVFAGHSLGEYAALTAVSDAFDVESLVDIVFLRGLVMQTAVVRDAQGRSEFGMVAANPLRVGPVITDERLHTIVERIDKLSGHLLQVVNYNVKGLQYVVAGHNVALDVFARVLTRVAEAPATLGRLDALVAECLGATQAADTAARLAGEVLKLKRGTATIPLPGIDVPFHSRFLQDGVPAFRACLEAKFDNDDLCRALPLLEGRYVPNVVARPFALTRAFAETVYAATQSEVLGKALAEWATLTPLALGRALVIELLAFQFASPVRWIETQHHFFTHGVRRLVEVGPAPTLANMALTTLAGKEYGPPKAFRVYFYGRAEDQDALYFRYSDETPSLPDFVAEYARAKRAAEIASGQHQGVVAAQNDATLRAPPEAPSVVEGPAPAASTTLPAATPARPPAVAASAALVDTPATALDVLTVLLALKLKKGLDAIPPDATLTLLCGGKSALLNEIVGDLEKEFGGAPESAAEMSLLELSKTMEAGYTPLGDVSQALVARLISAKMPGGFGAAAVRQHVATRGLGPRRTDAALLLALVAEPPSRLASVEEAAAFLDAAAQTYAGRQGISLQVPGSSAAVTAIAAEQQLSAGGAGGGAVAAAVPDALPDTLHTLRVLLAVKLKRAVSEIKPDASIKALVGGKSALENELVGDLEKEFGATPETASDMSLGELAPALRSGGGPLGPVVAALVARLLSGKMPGGFGAAAVRQYLASAHGLGAGRAESALAHGLAMAPADRLSTEAAARTWLDHVAAAYAADVGIRLGTGAGGNGVAAGSGGHTAGGALAASPRALQALRHELRDLLRDQAEAGQRFLGEDAFETVRQVDALTATLAEVEKELRALDQEHGETYRRGIRARFDAAKVRAFDSAWNWARQALLQLHHRLVRRELDLADGDVEAVRRYLLSCADATLVALASQLAQTAASQGHWRVSRWHEGLAAALRAAEETPPRYTALLCSRAPSVTVDDAGRIAYSEAPRADVPDMAAFVARMRRGAEGTPYLYVRAPASAATPFERTRSEPASEALYAALAQLDADGVSFAGRVALVTGCGEASIGLEMVKAFLQGGATVVATTSSFGSARSRLFQGIFQRHGARGARLIVFPFNQGSAQDCIALVEHIYSTSGSGLGLDLDFVIPFAAVSENGTTMADVGDRSELAHRLMATNVVRLLGAIKQAKATRGILTRPAQVVLPLSPNHGVFGHDGLYAESKLALEALLNKRESEGWYDYLNIVGAVIGWTRGTGLMAGNNIVAAGVEALGCWTFGTEEMAICLMALCHPRVVALCDESALLAHFGGGFDTVGNLSATVARLRRELLATAAQKAAVSGAATAVHPDPSGNSGSGSIAPAASSSTPPAVATPRARFRFEGTQWPRLPTEATRAEAGELLEGMVDLSSVAVVIGFGEVGPWGGSRTRWEMESYGEFSLEGCVELAWLTGHIRYQAGTKPGVSPGWVDTATGEAVLERDVKARYEASLLQGAGIRLVEPALFDGFEPGRKQFLHQVALDRHMPWVDTASHAEALEFRDELGEAQVDIRKNEDGVWQIRLRRGSTVTIPRALRFDRFVAGQVPNGWDAHRYGIPEDIAHQVDRVTLYSLVATAEALLAAGVADAYEFYEYVHVAEVGNTVGGGFGGMRSLRSVFQGRKLEQATQGDVLQESFINTVPAWINMLLLSSSGPIRTPVGACATAAESMELAVEAITTGRARVVVCGGYDDVGEESMYEFAQMRATSNSAAEVAMGREPAEMCRPTASTRGGFMEAHGAGIQVLCSAELALQMGCPIYAVVALTNTATDKEGRSVPAPGQGILTTCRERRTQFPSPLLNLAYRRRQLAAELASVEAWLEAEKAEGHGEADYVGENQGGETMAAFRTERQAMATAEAARMVSQARARWGNAFFRDRPDIAPLRGALAVWGLDVDDIAVASFHGTGTKANDKNESEVTHLQMEHLGRTAGNPLLVICQKWLTGHPKGAAAAWMLNGLLQTMATGLVPGNRNADNIAAELQKYTSLVYPNERVQLPQIRAALLKSFGFGQAGAEILLVHPDRLLATLTAPAYATYCTRTAVRERRSLRALHRVLAGKQPLIEVKTRAPYTDEQQSAVYLDPHARARYDPGAHTWLFSPPVMTPPPSHRRQASESDTARSSVAGSPSGFDRREASALLAALRRGRQFGHLRDPAEILEERHRAAADRRPGEFVAEDEADDAEAGEGNAHLEEEGIFRRAQTSPRPAHTGLQLAAETAAAGMMPGVEHGIGIDVEAASTFQTASSHFLDRNFTAQEQSYCRSTPHPAHSFAGRWAAKEAVIKAMSSSAEEHKSLWKGAAAPLRDIEIQKSPSGAPSVVLHGHAKKVATALGITTVKVSISYSSDHAVAQAVAQ